jgi:NAD(P)-dependent dehydrogenase (short-subunit alcohol dehydrogenase family)
MSFQGKRIVITGASRGIGYETAKLFLQAGADVFGTARDAVRLEKTAAELKGLGPFKTFAADLTDPAAPKQVAEAVSRHWGAVDLLVNNAAVQTWRKDWMAEGVDVLETDMRVNFFAPHALTFHLVPLLRNGDEPRVINVSSGVGTRRALMDSPNGASYRLSKYALNGLTMLWAGTLKGEVAVNSLDPGWLKTDLGGSQAPGEPVEGGKRVLALAALSPDVTGKFFHGDQEVEF